MITNFPLQEPDPRLPSTTIAKTCSNRYIMFSEQVVAAVEHHSFEKWSPKSLHYTLAARAPWKWASGAARCALSLGPPQIEAWKIKRSAGGRGWYEERSKGSLTTMFWVRFHPICRSTTTVLGTISQQPYCVETVGSPFDNCNTEYGITYN